VQPKVAREGVMEIEASGIGLKPYACCGAGVSLIDAALDLRREHHLESARIAAVECRVSDMAARIMPFHAAADGMQAKYCLEYCAAVALVDGHAGLAQFEDSRVAREDVQSLLRRVRVASDAAMASGEGRFGVEMRVRLDDGRIIQAALDVPRGHPRRPLEPDRMLAKFLECAAPAVGEARAREAANALQRLQDLPDLQPVIRPLQKETP
jgi:2-methylcitrate dehydratase PrpD